MDRLRNNVFFLLLVAVLLYSCNKERLNPMEYASYIEDPANGLKLDKTVNGYTFTLLYEPVEYKIVKDYRGKVLSKQTLEEECLLYDSLQYFLLRIKNNNSEDVLKSGLTNEAEYYGRIQYLTSVVQQDLHIVEGSDTLPCVLSHFERDYNLSPYVTLVLGFRSNINPGKGASDKLFIYEDNAFGTGTIKLQVKADDIDNIPALITE